MILASLTAPDSLVFKTGQRRQHIYGRINAFFIKVARKNNLSFGDISRKVGNRMRLIVLRHRQNGNLRNRALFSANPSRTLI